MPTGDDMPGRDLLRPLGKRDECERAKVSKLDEAKRAEEKAVCWSAAACRIVGLRGQVHSALVGSDICEESAAGGFYGTMGLLGHWGYVPPRAAHRAEPKRMGCSVGPGDALPPSSGRSRSYPMSCWQRSQQEWSSSPPTLGPGGCTACQGTLSSRWPGHIGVKVASSRWMTSWLMMT